jgi:protein-tyrosine phosphatase
VLRRGRPCRVHASVLRPLSEWFDIYGFGPIDEQLLTGAQPSDAGDVALLGAAGVTAVVNLCADSEYPEGAREQVEAAYAAAGIAEQRFETIDYGNLLPGLLETASDAVLDLIDGGEVVYLHCRAGWQRSTTVAAATLSRRDGIEPDAALGAIRLARPACEPLAHQLEDLWRWWRARASRSAP